MVNRYDLYLRLCPFCGHTHLIRWGYYKRFALPLKGFIRIQRIRCTYCGRTTNVLPSFLLARKSYTVSALKYLINAFINYPNDWKRSPEIIMDVSTAYRWLRILANQALQSLPAIRKTLLKIKPDQPIMDTTDAQPIPLTSTRVILTRFLSLAEQLHKAAVRLVDKTEPQNDDLFSFLNYFLAKTTAKPLLSS